MEGEKKTKKRVNCKLPLNGTAADCELNREGQVVLNVSHIGFP